jgi:para-nitrobenzyl esterase
MVWIHGGAFIVGTARSSWYDGTELASRGDVVVVTLQYRLGPLGFLDLSEAGGDRFVSSGDNGLLDQIAALRWVHDNIAAFGGDPDNVTLFGESAGGLSVEALIAAPASKGLFQKAIAQSPWLYAQTRTRASRIAGQFMALTHASTVDQLQSLTSEEILAGQREMYRARFSDTAFMPVIDGVTLPEQPVESIRKGSLESVPLLIGTTLEEMRYWSAFEALSFAQRTSAQLTRQLGTISGARSSRLIDVYTGSPQNAHSGVEPILTDAIFRMPAIGFAQANSAQAPTWMYLFTYRSTSTKYELGAAHAMELPFVFGGLNRPEIVAFTGTDDRREGLKEQIQDAWINFARTGDPNHAGLPTWPKYDTKSRPTMELGTPSRLLEDPYASERGAWSGVAFDGENPSLDQLTDLIVPAP